MSFIFLDTEKAIATQIHSHLINNDTVDNFQSVYKTGHSCETVLLSVYNDSVTTISAILVLLDLSAAFDTIDRDNLFSILEKYKFLEMPYNTNLLIVFFPIVLTLFKLIISGLTLQNIVLVSFKAKFYYHTILFCMFCL